MSRTKQNSKVNYDRVNLNLIQYYHNLKFLYILLVFFVLIILGKLYNLNFFYIAALICFFLFVIVIINYKTYKKNGNKITITHSKVILYIDNNVKEINWSNIKELVLEINGFDEGPWIPTTHGILTDNVTARGDKNYIKIVAEDISKYEFVIETEREMIVLRNVIHSLKEKGKSIRIGKIKN